MDPPAANPTPATPHDVLLTRGETIDRFVVLGLVGRGGMGEVYAAYDPELDRKVAIKLLRARSSDRVGADEGRARLLREAQAIAKLTHPNVVVVYDVGTVGDSIFIAMEFVDGQTLGTWLAAKPRSWREVLEVFMAAGRGLAAAHGAGIVHRDFKPENVMVTSDGQVRVMDFGLARQIGEAENAEAVANAAAAIAAAAAAAGPDGGPGELFDASSEPHIVAAGARGRAAAARLASSSSGRYLSIKLTQTGSLLGTPAYMAPEQFAALAGDARTDQFSFCVALYEGLYGNRPFAGDTLVSLMANVTLGEVREPPQSSRVPKWMRKVLMRGLRTDADRRFPTMNALLTALKTDPTVRPRRVVAVVAWLAFAVALAVGMRRVSGSTEALCRGGAERWAGVWEPSGRTSARRDRIRQAFAATGKSYAAQAFVGVTRLLNQYAGRWIAMYTDACEATHLRGEQSAEVLDLRMACLQERLTSARALTDLYASADSAVVENAVIAAGALPGLERCGDVPLLRAVMQPPRDEATHRRVEALRAQRARLMALRDAGHCADAERMADGLLREVRQIGYLPLLAETLNASCLLADQCIDVARGIERCRESYPVALASHHDLAAAEAATLLGGFLGDRGGQPEAGREWLAIARAMLARIGGDSQLERWARVGEGLILTREGRWAEALDAYQRSRASLEKALGKDHPDVLMLVMNEGNTLELAGRHEDALAADVAARVALSRTLGQDHPRVAMASMNEGEALNSLGRHAEARIGFQRAIDIWKRTGSDPFFISYGLSGLGLAYLGEGRPADAIAPLEEALGMRTTERVDPEHLGEMRFALARALWSKPAERKRARALAQQARADYADVKTAAASRAVIDAWLKAPG